MYRYDKDIVHIVEAYSTRCKENHFEITFCSVQLAILSCLYTKTNNKSNYTRTNEIITLQLMQVISGTNTGVSTKVTTPSTTIQSVLGSATTVYVDGDLTRCFCAGSVRHAVVQVSGHYFLCIYVTAVASESVSILHGISSIQQDTITYTTLCSYKDLKFSYHYFTVKCGKVVLIL